MNIRNLITLVIILLAGLTVVFITSFYKNPAISLENKIEEHQHHKEENEVVLSPETVTAANIEVIEVVEKDLAATLQVTGTVEANQQELQQASALVSGRIEKVNFVLGDYVKASSVLAIISSPQIAQMHGKMHEAETHLALAERNLQRIEKTENRVGVMSTKAKLDEAESNLERVRKLVEIGVGARKDLVSVETAYNIAKAEYEFQSNIALNREIQEARAEVAKAKVELTHIQDEMKAYGVPKPEEEHNHQTDTSLIPLNTPISGTVIERLINAGAVVEVGKPLFTIANLSTVWVIANVPESKLDQVFLGTKAEVKAAILGKETLTGNVTYIAPKLNEETRTAQVRIDVPNPKNRLNVGMFVEVGFQIASQNSQPVLFIPEEAIQRIENRTVVFIPKDSEPGHFEVREIELGGEVANSYSRVVSGLEKGEKLVTKGSFTLKTQLMKGQLEEDHH